MRDLVTQGQAAFFQAPEDQLIYRDGPGCNVNQCVQVSMFDFEFDQPSFGGM